MAQAQGGPTGCPVHAATHGGAPSSVQLPRVAQVGPMSCHGCWAQVSSYLPYALCSRLSCSRPRRCSGSSGVLEAGGKSRRTPGYMKKLGYCVHIICKAYVWVQGTPWYMANGTTHPLADRAVTRHFGAQRSPANSHVQRRLMAGACGLCSNSAPVQSGTAVHLR